MSNRFQTENCKELESKLKKLEEKRENFNNQLSLQKEATAKAQVLNGELQSKIQAQSAEIVSLKKVLSNAQRFKILFFFQMQNF